MDEFRNSCQFGHKFISKEPHLEDDLVQSLTPVKTGGQGIDKHLKILDSGFRRNDKNSSFFIFYEVINEKEEDDS